METEYNSEYVEELQAIADELACHLAEMIVYMSLSSAKERLRSEINDAYLVTEKYHRMLRDYSND